MAAPAEKTIKNLNGKWVMNKSLSDDFVQILKLQGVGLLLRNTIGYATITLDIKQYDNEQGVTQIDVSQTGTGGLKGTDEHRILDWSERSHSDRIFGDVTGRTKWVKIPGGFEPGYGAEEAEFLGKDWEGDEVVLSWVRNEKAGWSAVQVWGFQVINGERRHARHVVVNKGKEKLQERLVYDYQG